MATGEGRDPRDVRGPGGAPRRTGVGASHGVPDAAGAPGIGMRIDLNLHVDEDTPVFVISVAAQLAGMHPQTLRQYDRLGLVTPGRTAGRGRRYSPRDVAVLREVQRLSQEEGVNLAGIKRILELELENERLRARVQQLTTELEELRSRILAGRRVFAADAAGGIVAMAPGRRPERAAPSSALVVWRPHAGR